MNTEASNKLHLLVFGATGRTGMLVVNNALEKGYAVTAIARNPANFTIRHPLLTVIQGDVLQLDSFANNMAGVQAVISCLGSDGTKPTRVFSQGMQNILEAMQGAGVKRLMCLSASAIVINPKLPAFYRFVARYIVQKILKNPYNDLRIMEKMLEHSAADYTIVRPPQLTQKPLTGKYRYAIDSFLEKSLKITRADLADFMVANITNTAMYETIVEVAN